MTEHEPLLTRQIEIADAHFRTDNKEYQGSRIREMANLRRIRRRRRRTAGATAVGLTMLALVAVQTGTRPDSPILARPTADVFNAGQSGSNEHDPDFASARAQLNQLKRQASILQKKLDLLETERVVLRMERRLAFQIDFPDLLETISARNYAAQQFLSSIDPSSQTEGQIVRLQDVVAYFPGTIAAQKAAGRLQ